MKEKLTENEVSNRIASKGNFEYAGGFVDTHTTFKIRCKSCGEVFERDGSMLKKHIKIRCPKCNPWFKKDRVKAIKPIRNDLDLLHKKNKVLMTIFPENWLALYISVVTDATVDKANSLMGFKKAISGNGRKQTIDWETVDKYVSEKRAEGLNFNKIAREINVSANALYVRYRGKKVQA